MYAYSLVALLLFSGVTVASEACNIKNIRDFYNRLKSTGPLQTEAEKKKEQVSSSINLAEQRPNPKLEFESLKGDQFGVNTSNLALSAKHIIEFGSKRDKRIERAKSFQRLKSTEVDLALFSANLQAAISYQRIAQLNITIESVKEAIQTFNIITRKLSSRSRLNPEETVSLSTLRLASNDYKAQLNDLENEKTLLLGRIQFLSKCTNVIPRYEYLAYQKLSFSTQETGQKGLLKLEDLKVELASGELDVQRSLGYSNIAIGPNLQYQEQGNVDTLSVGIAVSFALPLFQTNDGGKLNALKSLSTQKTISKNKKDMLNVKRMNLITKFKRSLSTLLKMPNLEELEKKHQKVEKLFSRGVVSIPMTIESHRQQIEFLKSRFETENDVLHTLGELSLISGDLEFFDTLF